MQTGKKGLIHPQKFEKLGLIRDAWRSPSWLSRLTPRDRLTENPITGRSAESFHEMKAVKVALEVKRAEALCHARRILNIPR